MLLRSLGNDYEQDFSYATKRPSIYSRKPLLCLEGDLYLIADGRTPLQELSSRRLLPVNFAFTHAQPTEPEVV